MKYELLKDQTIQVYGRTLYRIRRLSDGLIGGFIESEANLSQEGSCFVFNDAMVFESARVSGSAEVSGSARVLGSAEVSGSARVLGSAEVSGSAKVFGSAWVCGSARVLGSAEVFESTTLRGFDEVESVKDFIYLSPSPYSITVTRCGVNIGCKSFTFDELDALTHHADYEAGQFQRQKFMIWLALDEILNND